MRKMIHELKRKNEIVKRKILYFIQLPPPVHGVTTINKYVYTSSIINEKFKIDLLEINYSDEISQLNNINIFKLFQHLILGFRLLTKLYKNKPDIIYFTIVPTGIGFIRDLLFVAIIKSFRVKVIYHLHGKGIAKKKGIINTKIYQWVFKKSTIIHLSKGLLESELGHLCLNKTNLYYVENGIKYAKGNRYDVDLRKIDNIIRILYLSNMSESKGILQVLDAFKIIHSKHSTVEQHIVGSCSYDKINDKIRDTIESTNNKLIFHGPLFGEEKKQIFKQTDLMIFPTLNDAFPLVLLEAMSYKIPIISTFQGAIPDIIDNNLTGFLVPEGNVNRLVEKIDYLIINNDIMNKMGQKGYEKFKSNFTYEIFEEKMKNIFKSIL